MDYKSLSKKFKNLLKSEGLTYEDQKLEALAKRVLRANAPEKEKRLSTRYRIGTGKTGRVNEPWHCKNAFHRPRLSLCSKCYKRITDYVNDNREKYRPRKS